MKNIEYYDLDERISYICTMHSISGVAEYDTIFHFIEQFVVGFIARTYYYYYYSDCQQLIGQKEEKNEGKHEGEKHICYS